MSNRWTQLRNWLDEHLLFTLSFFLLFFIPLWPKIPLADLIPGYIVRLRLEDILVFATFVIYLVQVWRGRIDWRLPTWQLIFAYVAVGLMSILSGIWLVHTLPWSVVHIGKSILHWARYIEYFFLAFLFFSSVRSAKQLSWLAAVMLIVTTLISIYAFGQKYFYWPVYSTMNREFSKGIRLVLTPHARVQSTFGGHYDFAAYLVLLLPFTLLIARHARQLWPQAGRWASSGAWTAHFLGVWSLIVSAARTSIIAYLAAVLLIFALDNAFSPDWPVRRWGRWLGQQLGYFLIVGLLVFGWGQDMIERFAHVIDGIQPLHDAYHTANKWRKEFPYLLGWKEWEQPEGTIAVVVDDLGNNTAAGPSVITPTDTRPQPAKPTPTPTPTPNTPSDVYVDVPDIKVAIDASGHAYTYEATRTWSVNAEKYGLSMAIRFDTLWPNALRGFERNIWLGSAYGTLTKGENLDVFTEADSTDCNYLRTLGETGLLGFITFYGGIAIALYTASRRFTTAEVWGRVVNLGFLTATIGLLINAIYIDVFAASKVAFTFWMIYGIFWASQKLTPSSDETNIDPA